MINQGEVTALISLIEDPDEDIFKQVRERLLSFGNSVIPRLEKACKKEDFGDLYTDRIGGIICSIRAKDTQKQLQAWVKTGARNLLEGVLNVCSHRYPFLPVDEIEAEIRAIAQDIWLEIDHRATSFDKIQVFNRIFFEVYKFEKEKALNAKRNIVRSNYLNEVLSRKRGSPIGLAIVYQAVAEKLELPIFGVNLPKYFILAYMNEVYMDGKQRVDFYVNPFAGGDILGKNEIDEFMQKQKLSVKEQYLPCGNISTVRQLLNDLIYGYRMKDNHDYVLELKELREVLDENEDDAG